jgi:PAS domain S-box-containing protein
MDGPIRVLYVESDPQFRQLTVESLQRASDRLDVVAEGHPDGGLARVREEAVDCVVADHEFPSTTGLDFLDAVRAESPGLPFILFTGTGSEAVASKSISAGVTDYFRKRGSAEQYALLANRIENAVERRRADQRADRRKRRLETLISNLPGIVYRCRNEPGWPMEYVAGEAEDLVGYSAETLAANEVNWGEEVLHPDDRERAWEEVQAAIERGEPFECTYRVVTADEEVRWMWEQGRTVTDSGVDVGDGPSAGGDAAAADRATIIEGFITDVTESKRRERELQRSERRFRAIFDDPNLLVGLLDTDGRVEEVNRTALEYVGIEPEDVIGEDFSETPWWTAEMREDVREWVRLAAAGEYVSYEATHPNPAGDPITVQGFFRPVTDDAGTVTAIVVSARDVTARREREEKLERQYERLDEFASFVSHDFQSPISAARGRLELALETDDDAHIERAIDAIERIDELRTDLVDTLRSGDIVSEPAILAVDDVLETVWETVDPPAEASFRTDGAIEVAADREALQRLLENLVRNSVEHGGDDVDVRVGETDGGFYYEDSGPGIDPEHRGRVFSPGFSTKRDDDGTGMGLASVRQIVSAHGWEIDVDDAERLDGVRFEIHTE